MAEISDLTIVYYTAEASPQLFRNVLLTNLVEAMAGCELVIVKKPVDTPRSHLQIYRQALQGAKQAETKYIALCEDDILYSPEHFKYRPNPGKFAYNLGTWNIDTWGDTMFTHKAGGRRNLHSLICERDLFIEAMEERFAEYPDDKVDLGIWAEPSKYERQLGVTVREHEVFYTNPPNIVFIHQTALAFQNLGKRKRLGEFRAIELPYWGTAEKVRSYYV